MNKDQQCRTSKNDGNILCNIFFHKQSFRRCPEYADNMFVCYYPPVSRKCDSVDQSTDSVCSSNLPAPVQASQYPNGGVSGGPPPTIAPNADLFIFFTNLNFWCPPQVPGALRTLRTLRIGSVGPEYSETRTAQYGSVSVTTTFGGGNTIRSAP